MAKEAAESLALDRLAANGALEAALSGVERLAIERLAALEALEAEADRRARVIAELEVPARELARLRSSRLWPLIARLVKTDASGV